MTPLKDPLYDLLEKRLNSRDSLILSKKDLIYHVVGDYIYLLMNEGFLPQSQIDMLEDFLKEETLIMIQKKIYGYPDFRSFIRAQKPR